MKIAVVRECAGMEIPGRFTLDLKSTRVRDCAGCWSCWLKTPGRCVCGDLDDFYRAWLDADKVIIFTEVSMGFVSGRLKTLFDRMLPLFLPYITYKSGESMHLPRYARYPDVEVWYRGDFSSAEEKQHYEEYIRRVFYQFYSKCDTVRPITQFKLQEMER